MMHVSEMVMNVRCMPLISNVVISVGGIFSIKRVVCCMTYEEKLSIQ